jgi:hypothetical protein
MAFPYPMPWRIRILPARPAITLAVLALRRSEIYRYSAGQ